MIVGCNVFPLTILVSIIQEIYFASLSLLLLHDSHQVASLKSVFTTHRTRPNFDWCVCIIIICNVPLIIRSFHSLTQWTLNVYYCLLIITINVYFRWHAYLWVWWELSELHPADFYYHNCSTLWLQAPPFLAHLIIRNIIIISAKSHIYKYVLYLHVGYSLICQCQLGLGYLAILKCLRGKESDRR